MICVQLQVRDVQYFKNLMQCLTRFIDKAHFEVSDEGMRIRSVDPHDFCYVDTTLSPAFFQEYTVDNEVSFVLEITKLAKIAHLLSVKEKLSIDIRPGVLRVKTTGEWSSTYSISWLAIDPHSLPEPQVIKYEARMEIPPKKLLEEARKASAISHELSFAIEKGTFLVKASSGNYLFETKPSSRSVLENHSKDDLSVSIIGDYLTALSSVMTSADQVHLNLGKDKPLKMELSQENVGTLAFYLSSRRRMFNRPDETGSGESLPRVSVTRLHEFVNYIADFPDGIPAKLLASSEYETTGRDYTRLSRIMGLIRIGENISLTEQGEQFTRFYAESEGRAKAFLNKLAFERIPQYEIVVRHLTLRPMAFDELLESANLELSEKKIRKLDKSDLATLLGIATWCGVADKRLALYYFGKSEDRGAQ